MSSLSAQWRHRLLALSLLAAALFGACAERAPARFPHQPHLTRSACGTPDKPECLTCNDCHSVSQKNRAHKLPALVKCEGCHKEDAHKMRAVLQAPPGKAQAIAVTIAINCISTWVMLIRVYG